MTDDLTLSVGGNKLSGWQDVRVTCGIERVPNDFDISFTERFPGEVSSVSVRPGDACTVSIGSDVVITGYVDRFEPRIDQRQHTIRARGRSKSQDMVDCAAEWPGGQISGDNVLGIAQKLAKPYGITVAAKDDAGKPIPQFNLMLGETAWEIVERICRYSALLCYDMPDGTMIMARVGTDKHASGVKQGENVQTALASFTMDQRFSEVIAYIQSVDLFGDSGNAGNLIATETDPNVPRHRRHVIISEQFDINFEITKQRARWEISRRAGRSKRIEVTVDSWRDSAGKLWTPNRLVSVDLPMLKVAATDLIIGQVSFRRGEQGTLAELILMPSEAFKPEPFKLQPDALAPGERASAGP